SHSGLSPPFPRVPECPGTVVLAAAWGALVIVMGLVQEALAPGSWHWTIQVLHVAISMGAIWWGRRLGATHPASAICGYNCAPVASAHRQPIAEFSERSDSTPAHQSPHTGPRRPPVIGSKKKEEPCRTSKTRSRVPGGQAHRGHR